MWQEFFMGCMGLMGHIHLQFTDPLQKMNKHLAAFV
jgi:hypothetical protein